jgi:hypothetical protein
MQYNKALRSPRSCTRSLTAAKPAAHNSTQIRQVAPRSNFFPNKSLEGSFFGEQTAQKNRPVQAKNPTRLQREIESFSFFVPGLPTSRRKFFIIESTPLSLLVVYQLSGAEGATFTWQQNHPNHAKLRLQVKKQASRPQRSPPSAPRAICGRHKAGESRRVIRRSMI